MEVKCKVVDVKRPTRLSVTGLNIIGKMLAIGKKQTSSKTTVYLNEIGTEPLLTLPRQ